MSDSAAEGKNAAIVSYMTFIGTIVAIFMNSEKKNTFAAFHIRQAMGIYMMFFALGYFIGNFNSWTVTLVFWAITVILLIYGFLGALNGQAKPIPLFGDFFKKIFKNLQ